MSYYAEFETDRVIREAYFPDIDYRGTMVEVGAGETEWLSTSKHFRDNGWRCIGIDPNPSFAKKHRDLGNEIYEYACSYKEYESDFTVVGGGLGFSALEIRYLGSDGQERETIKVKVRRLNDILREQDVLSIDFLSIDTEGWELEVMMGFNSYKYRPKVILLENYTYDPFYERYMNDIGYKLDKQISYNHIYVRDVE